MDINHLNINELEALNKKVVERLHELHAQNDKLVLTTLLPDMQGQFMAEGKTYTGVLSKKNRRNVIVATDNGKKQYTLPAGIIRPVHATNTKITQAVNKMTAYVTTQPQQSDIDEIRAGLGKHNTPFISDIYRTDVACYLHNEQGNKLGGLVGEIWGQWLMVKFLWVDEQQLGKGLGRQLLNKAEEFARSKGCKFSFLDTFSFQAKPFYEKQDYSVQMTLKNFPIESMRYYMTKQL